MREIAAGHDARIEEVEPGAWSFGVEPAFALGQRALYASRTLWDCIPLFNDELQGVVEREGGLEQIVLSHPHTYGAARRWAEAFDTTILIHAADRDLVVDPGPRVEYWGGDRLDLGADFELIRLGGHFDGSCVALWKPGADGRGALFASDTLHVCADNCSVAFMRNHSRFEPLAGADVTEMIARLEGVQFDRVYGIWPGRMLAANARQLVLEAASAYLNSIRGVYRT